MTRAPRRGLVVLGAAVLLIGPVVSAPAQTPLVEYVDRSSETALQYAGQPRNAMNLNYDNDSYKDFVLTRFENHGAAYGYDGYDISLNGVPEFVENTSNVFPSGIEPGDGTTGVITADFDNDGHVDLFACDHANGAKLYRNDGGAGYVDFTASSGLDPLASTSVYSAS